MDTSLVEMPAKNFTIEREKTRAFNLGVCAIRGSGTISGTSARAEATSRLAAY